LLKYLFLFLKIIWILCQNIKNLINPRFKLSNFHLFIYLFISIEF